MSNGIICDRCNKAFYSDSRSDKDAYATIVVDFDRSQSYLHLCKSCYKEFYIEFSSPNKTDNKQYWDDFYEEVKTDDE